MENDAVSQSLDQSGDWLGLVMVVMMMMKKKKKKKRREECQVVELASIQVVGVQSTHSRECDCCSQSRFTEDVAD